MSASKITWVIMPASFLEDPYYIYPMGIVAMHSAAQQAGLKSKVLDLAGMRQETAIIRNLKEAADTSDILAISAVTAQYKWMEAAAQALSGHYTVVGGPHASAEPESVLKLGYKAVVVGDGEPMLGRIQAGDQGILQGGRVEDLDDLPAWDRSRFSHYRGPVPLMATRGCIGACSFCATDKGRVRYRSVESVGQEVDSIPAKDFVFYDDTLTAQREWVLQLCFRIHDKSKGRTFKCSTRADKLDDDLLKTMRAAGFNEIRLGVEAGDPGILRTIRKAETPEQTGEAVKMIQRNGLRAKAYIMVGLPGESMNTLDATRRWIEAYRPNLVAIYPFTPLPGCDIWKNPDRYDLKFEKGFENCYYGGKAEKLRSRVSTSYLTSDQITQEYLAMLKDYQEMIV